MESSYTATAPGSFQAGANVGQMASDMRTTGLFQIIFGALTCLGIVSAIVGIPLLLSGLRLREAADSFERYHASGDTAGLAEAFRQQAESFKYHKWYYIAALIFAALYMVIVFAFMGTMIASMSGDASGY